MPSDDPRPAFDRSVAAWLEYTASPAGQLRHALMLQHLRQHLPQQPCRALDAGGGTGEMAAALAELGHSVTLLDFSQPYLDQARRRCQGLPVSFVCADAARAPDLFGRQCFDIVLCHSLMEFSDDAVELLRSLCAVLRRGGLFSLVAGNRCHWPLREALARRDLGRARQAMDRESAGLDLFGLPRRTFYPHELQGLAAACGLTIIGEYGVRVFADLLDWQPPLDQLQALELAASARLPYRHIARFLQLVAVKEE